MRLSKRAMTPSRKKYEEGPKLFAAFNREYPSFSLVCSAKLTSILASHGMYISVQMSQEKGIHLLPSLNYFSRGDFPRFSSFQTGRRGVLTPAFLPLSFLAIGSRL